ncbi:hypothetical protein D3C81_1385720 [compost metagenome]
MGQLTLPGGDGETPEPRMHQLTRAGLIQCGQQPVALRQEVIPGDKAGELVLPRAPAKVFDKGLIALRELMQLGAPTDRYAVGVYQERHPSKGGALFAVAPFTHYGLLPSVR